MPNLNKQKIIVEKGKMSSSCYIPYEILYTETVLGEQAAKDRVKELKEEYKDVEGISIHYFSL